MVRKPLPVEICDIDAPFRNGNFPWGDFGYKNFYHNPAWATGVWYGYLTFDLDSGVRKPRLGLHQQVDYTDDTETALYFEVVTGCSITTTQHAALTNPFSALTAVEFSDIVVRGFNSKIYVVASYEYTAPSAGGGYVYGMYDIGTATMTTGYLDSYGGATFVPSNLDILSDGTKVYLCCEARGTGIDGFLIQEWGTTTYYTKTTAEHPIFGYSDTGYFYFYGTSQKRYQFDVTASPEIVTDAIGISEVPTTITYAKQMANKTADFIYLITATKVYWSVNGTSSWFVSDTYTRFNAPIWQADNQLFAVLYDDHYIFLDAKGAVKFFILPEFDLYLTYDLQFQCGWHETDGDYLLRFLLSTLWQMQYVAVDILGLDIDIEWHTGLTANFGQIDVINDSEYIRLYDDDNNLLIEGYATDVQSDNKLSYRCMIDSKQNVDLETKVNGSYTGTRKAIFEELITDWCDYLSIGTIELDNISAITIVYNNKTLKTCFDELCQLEGDMDWYFTRNGTVYVNNLDTPADFALEDNFTDIQDAYTNITINSVTVKGKWIAGVQAEYTKSSGAIIYDYYEVSYPTLDQAQCQTMAENILANRNQKYYTYRVSYVFGEYPPELGTLINLTWGNLSLTAQPCYVKRVVFEGNAGTFDLVLTDAFIYRREDTKQEQDPIYTQQIADVSSNVSSSSHVALTVDAAPNPLSLTTQLLQFKNDAGNKITEIDTAATLEDTDVKIPTSKRVKDAVDAKANIADPTFTTKATAPYFVSSAAIGTQPFQCTSTTKNTNLNAHYLGGADLETTWSDSDTKVCSSKGIQTKIAGQLHDAVTVTASRPLRLSTQLISVANDEDNEVTSIEADSIDQAAGGKLKIPSSYAVGLVKTTADAAMPKSGGTFSDNVLFATDKKAQFRDANAYIHSGESGALKFVGTSYVMANAPIIYMEYITSQFKWRNAANNAWLSMISVDGANYLQLGAEAVAIGANSKQIKSIADATEAQDAVSYAQLSAKANLASPDFTGTPAAPTAAAGTNSTQLATTAYADAAIPFCVVSRITSAQTIPNESDTTILWNNDIEDTFAMHDPSSNADRIYCVKAGVYNVSAIIGFAVNATGSRSAFIDHYNSGGTKQDPKRGGGQTLNPVSTAINCQMSISRNVRMAVGDYIVVYVYQSSGGNLSLNYYNVEWEPCSLQICWVGY